MVETFETDVTGFSGRRQLLDAALAASRRCKLSAEEEAATVLISPGSSRGRYPVHVVRGLQGRLND